MTTEKQAQDAMVPMGAEGAQGGAPGSGNPNFERSFADLAYAHLKDKAPKLLDFLVGFQVMDKNDDETKAAGVFGFQVGKQWFYAPVFFLNGELKGHDLLYIKEQDAFVPLQENWVNYLISRKPAILGQPERRSEGELGLRAPNYWTYSRSPIRNSWNKVGACEADPETADEVHGYWNDGTIFDLRPVLDVMGTPINSGRYKEAAARMDLSRVVQELGVKASKFLVSSIKADPRFAQSLSKFYSGRELLPQIKQAETVAVRPPSDEFLRVNGLDRALFRLYTSKLARVGYTDIKGTDGVVIRILNQVGIKSASDLRSNLDTVLAEPERRSVKQASDPTLKVEVISRSEAMDAPESLTDDERTEVMDEGFIVRDDRTSDEKTKVYDIDMTDQLSNPDGSGIYDMLSKDGKTHEVLVIESPYTVGAGVANITLVLKTDGKGWASADSKAIIVRKDKIGDWKPFYDKLPEVGSMSEGNTYVILCEDCTSSLVLNVVEKAGDDLYVNVPYCSCDISTIESRGTIKDRWMPKVHHEYPSDSLDESMYKEDKKWWRNDVRKVSISDKAGKLKPIGDTLLVPSDAKVLQLSTSRSDLGFIPGSITDAELMLLKDAGLNMLRVHSDGLGYQIDDGKLGSRLQEMDLIRTLVNQHGVTKAAARLMRDRANERGTDTFHVKYAQGYGLGAGGPLTPGPAAPPVSVLDNAQTYDQELGVMSNYDEVSNEPVNLPLSSQDDYNPMEVDPQTVQATVQAAQSGQKEVLDTSVLGGMVKAMDTDPIIDKYLADLVVGEDRIGRILFMFYWHNEKFRDRYGDDEMQELEDALNNTFKSVGDLVLFLKKRTIEPDSALMGSDVDLDSLS